MRVVLKKSLKIGNVNLCKGDRGHVVGVVREDVAGVKTDYYWVNFTNGEFKIDSEYIEKD